MLFNLIFAAAIAGSASAASMPKRSYGQLSRGNAGGGNNGSHGGGYGSESSSVSPVVAYSETASPGPSSMKGVYPIYSTGRYPSPSPYPLGGSSYPPSSGTGINSHPPYPIPSGSVAPPKGPTDSGSAPVRGPTGSGSLSPPGPTGTGSLPPPRQTTTTTTVYGGAATTTTKTLIGMTTVVDIVTKFSPCSTPVATAKGSTYYSTYLTIEYQTSTRTITTTQEVVVCPATPVPEVPARESSSGSLGSGSPGSSGSNASPGHPSPEHPPTTAYGPGSLPTSGTCPASATTVYSTLVVTMTVSAGPTPTHCGECTTYHITLPNGQLTSVIVDSSPTTPAGGNPPYPTHGPYKPTYPIGSGTGSVSKPTGSGTGTAVKPTGARLPNGSGDYSPSPVYRGYGHGDN